MINPNKYMKLLNPCNVLSNSSIDSITINFNSTELKQNLVVNVFTC